ncbi:hypothetical protein ACFWOY_21065 [Streptomyces sp. NPDC058423]|uniref:hypothetical protein n=1 Tax=unclassified Streptomyces TaxID=2593676 RepID=UPI00364B835C
MNDFERGITGDRGAQGELHHALLHVIDIDADHHPVVARFGPPPGSDHEDRAA